MKRELRYYKGGEPVEIVLKSRMNYLVESMVDKRKFVTVPRLLWRNPKMPNNSLR